MSSAASAYIVNNVLSLVSRLSRRDIHASERSGNVLCRTASHMNHGFMDYQIVARNLQGGSR